MELTIYQVIFLYCFGPDQNYVPSYAFMQNKISLSHRVLSITSSTLTLIAFIERKKKREKILKVRLHVNSLSIIFLFMQ